MAASETQQLSGQGSQLAYIDGHYVRVYGTFHSYVIGDLSTPAANVHCSAVWSCYIKREWE